MSAELLGYIGGKVCSLIGFIFGVMFFIQTFDYTILSFLKGFIGGCLLWGFIQGAITAVVFVILGIIEKAILAIRK